MIKKYGWNQYFQDEFENLNTSFKPARIISQHSNLYKVISEEGELLAEKSGKFEYFIESDRDLPAIGDWVLVDILGDEKKAIIHKILPRKSILSRKKSGKEISEQVIASNIDLVFVVSGLDDNFNLNRVERYVTLIKQFSIKPVLIFNKSDLKRSLVKIKKEVDKEFKDIDSFYISAVKNKGVEDLKPFLKKGSTVCFVGSSGVGKSSIINVLLGEDKIRISEVREADSKGRHTTSNKQIFCLPGGALVIDTPGMREIGLWGDDDKLESSFFDIIELSQFCNFNDCEHISEPDCAVLKAVNDNELSESRYDNFIKLKKELKFIQMKKDNLKPFNSKKRWKEINKNMKQKKKHNR